MNLHSLLLEREAAGRPVTVGVIGAGKFGTMFLAQARLTRGLHVVAVADLNVERARSQLATAGWPAEQFAAASLGDAVKLRRTHVTADAAAMIAHPAIEVIIEATGIPEAGIVHATKAIEHGKHIVMVNVEADALAGPLLARKAKAAGVVYSLAWGDQPALICEHVDWARACGFKVIAAGKGTRYEPHYHRSNPDNVWDILDKYLNISDRKSINPKMFNSFVDGTKSGIEMTAVCNATGLVPQTEGLSFPPATRFELADVCKPKSAGGVLGKGRRHRGHLVGHPRRQGRAASSGARHLRGDRGRDRLRAPLLQGIRHAARPERPLRRAVPADPHDRARARHLGCERGAPP